MTPRFVLAGVAALALSASMPIAASAATRSADGDGKASVVDTETVQAYLDATGAVQSQRVYEQLVVRGSGSVTVTNPVSTQGLRNLDGFGGAEVRDGAQVTTYDLDAADGVVRGRTVSDHEGDLPLTVSVRYLLDGEEVAPGDVVGSSGHLRVEYTVENTTARTQQVEIPDGHGGTTTRQVPVAVPFAGTLTTTLPASFTEVSSERGNLAGDGRGGTKVSFTMTLFPPIGSPKTTLTYEADVADGVVPRAEISALPVNPMKSPTFATAAEGYRKGSATGTELAAGAGEMDANLLKLRDGAQDLLGGLVQLHDGADQLTAGLSGKAVPGARKLAAGAGDLDAGMTRIADGTGAAAEGSRDLRDGLARISDGLGQLADVDGLPKAARGAAALKAGVDQVLAGFGAVGTDGTLLDGLAQLETGLGHLAGGLTQLQGGLGQAKGGVDQSKAGVDQVRAGLSAAVADGGSLDQLLGGLTLLTTLDCGPICQNVLATKLIPGVQGSKTQLTAARDGLSQVAGGLGAVSTGLGQAIGGLQTQLVPGAQAAAAGAAKANDGAVRLDAGLQKIRNGLDDLENGLTRSVAGVLALDEGAGTAHTGAGDLAAGLGLLAEGTDTAHDGSSRLAAGNAELAGKLVEAADGSGQIADGLGEAVVGTPRLVDGAGRLSKEGAQVIAGKGSATAQDYGELVAVMEAGGKRADAEQMAYGAPEGAVGLTAYNLVIEGEDGAGGRNLARGLAGGGLLAAAAGVGFLRRRLV